MDFGWLDIIHISKDPQDSSPQHSGWVWVPTGEGPPSNYTAVISKAFAAVCEGKRVLTQFLFHCYSLLSLTQMTYAWTCMKIQSKTIQNKMEMRYDMADNLEGQETGLMRKCQMTLIPPTRRLTTQRRRESSRRPWEGLHKQWRGRRTWVGCGGSTVMRKSGPG